MDKYIQACIENLTSQDRDIQNKAFLEIQTLTNEKVDWNYEIWDGLKNDLTHPDNHQRAIAAQLLCNLAKSDPDGRMLGDFSALMEVTRDNRFVTARHCLQSLWKIGSLLEQLSFTRGNRHWGYLFRSGHFEIGREDFLTIAGAMLEGRNGYGIQ